MQAICGGHLSKLYFLNHLNKLLKTILLEMLQSYRTYYVDFGINIFQIHSTSVFSHFLLKIINNFLKYIHLKIVVLFL
jgi:hypothetical protein